MKKVLVMIGATVGGAVGWWLGSLVGITSAVMVSAVGTGAGMYAGTRLARQYLP